MSLSGDVRARKVAAAGSLRPPEVHAGARAEAGIGRKLSLSARVLLWDFERGSLAYDLLCLFLVLLLLLVPAAWWGDPMVSRP